MDAFLQGFFGRCQQARHTGYEPVVVAKESVAGCHILGGVLSGGIAACLESKGVLGHFAVQGLHELLAERVVEVRHHEVERSEVVGYLGTFEQRTADGHHSHALLAEYARIVDREAVSLYCTGMGREQYLVVLHKALPRHP